MLKADVHQDPLYHVSKRWRFNSNGKDQVTFQHLGQAKYSTSRTFALSTEHSFPLLLRATSNATRAMRSIWRWNRWSHHRQGSKLYKRTFQKKFYTRMHSSIKKILSNKKNSVYIIDILPEMISCHLQLVPLKAWMLKWMSLFKNIFLGDSEGLGWSHLRSWINFCVEASFLAVVICSKTPRFAKVYSCHGGLQIITIGKHTVYQSALADIELKME